METVYLYIGINILVILVPLIFSFDKKVAFFKEWKAIFTSIAVIGTLFIAGDILYTYLGYWGFNPRYLLPFRIGGLPISEILFFITIPYACLFIYANVKTYFNQLLPLVVVRTIYSIIALSSVILVVLYFNKPYSLFAGFFGVVLASTSVVFKPNWYRNFALSFVVALIPFLIVNGVLTGSGIAEEVVWYNNAAICNYRILTIPVEDFIYGFNLLWLTTWIYEKRLS